MYEYAPNDFAVYEGKKLLGLGKDRQTLAEDVFPTVGWAFGSAVMGAFALGAFFVSD